MNFDDHNGLFLFLSKAKCILCLSQHGVVNNHGMYVPIKYAEVLAGKTEIKICHNNQEIVITDLVLHFHLSHFYCHYQYLFHLTSDLSSLPHFAGDSRILKRNVFSLPHAKIFRNLPHFSFLTIFLV